MLFLFCPTMFLFRAYYVLIRPLLFSSSVLIMSRSCPYYLPSLSLVYCDSAPILSLFPYDDLLDRLRLSSLNVLILFLFLSYYVPVRFLLSSYSVSILFETCSYSHPMMSLFCSYSALIMFLFGPHYLSYVFRVCSGVVSIPFILCPC